MDRNSNNYVLLFVVVMTVVAALALTVMRQGTMAKALQNEEIFNKRAILAAVSNQLGDGVSLASMTDQQVLDLFKNNVTQVALSVGSGQEAQGVVAEKIDLAKERKKPVEERTLPLFVYENNGEKYYILSVRGNGLWDEIWGNVALKSDLNTVVGASFDHKGETPGLGAEIKDNPTFSKNFIDTHIFRDGEYVSVKVRKGGAQDKAYEVDGISGATVTSDGVSKMLYDGIKLYMDMPYFQALRSEGASSMLIKK